MNPLRRSFRIWRTRGTGTLVRRGVPFARRQAKRRVHRVGNRRTCPLCGNTSRRFLPVDSGWVGEDVRPDAECPWCGSLERHRLLWVYLREETSLFEGAATVLHVGPNRALERGLRETLRGRYLTLDLDDGTVDLRGDLAALPFPDSSFDLVLCSHVLEHVPDDGSAMAELARVLAPGAWAVVQVPMDDDRAETYEDLGLTDPAEREREFGQHDHVRVYGADFEERLDEAGVDVAAVRYPREFAARRAERWGLDSKDVLYVCTVRE